MVDAVIPSWHGGNYQARFFWENAFNLLIPTTCVKEVTFEANGPKAFDDVVVKYDPPVAYSGPERVPAEYYQVKWHKTCAKPFGVADMIDPAFIDAKRHSLLERLMQARRDAPGGAAFTLITSDRIKEGDPLGQLISNNDHMLLVDKLFAGTTDRGKMGKVRKLWREHLGLKDDNELRLGVTGFRIIAGYATLDGLRQRINEKAQWVGLMACSNAHSDFRYDELARQLKVRNINTLTRESFVKLCQEEGLFAQRPAVNDPFLPVAIRCFLGAAADIAGEAPEDTLLLTDEFRERYLRDDRDWQQDIRPKVEEFLCGTARKSRQLRLSLAAHASVAFLAGSVLHLKTGVEVELIQNGRIGSRPWRADDGTGTQGVRFEVREDCLGHADEIAISISISQPTEAQTRSYVTANLPNVGRIVSFNFPEGPGQRSVAGGEHACMLADQVSNTLRNIKAQNPDGMVHIFAACPNSFLYFLGQQFQAIAPCIFYEFDFDRRANKTYYPTFVIDWCTDDGVRQAV